MPIMTTRRTRKHPRLNRSLVRSLAKLIIENSHAIVPFLDKLQETKEQYRSLYRDYDLIYFEIHVHGPAEREVLEMLGGCPMEWIGRIRLRRIKSTRDQSKYFQSFRRDREANGHPWIMGRMIYTSTRALKTFGEL